jgi:hypothetical protein
MATNREMLKEAIAEAKAVKEMAIANAKAALEETFTPQLKSILSAKLQEMEKEEEELDEAGFGPMINVKGHGNIEDDSSLYEEEMEEGEGENMYEVDLEELLAELNEEEEMEENLNEAEEGEEEEEEEETEDTEMEDLSDDEIKSMIEDVIAQMIADKELEAGPEFEAEEGEEMEMSDEDEEEVDLAELLKEIEDMEENKNATNEDFNPSTVVQWAAAGFSAGLFALSTAYYFTKGAVKKEQLEKIIMDLVRSQQTGTLDEKWAIIQADMKKDPALKQKVLDNLDFIQDKLGLSLDDSLDEAGEPSNPKNFMLTVLQNIAKEKNIPIEKMVSQSEKIEKDIKKATKGDSTQMEEELAEALSTIETLKAELNEINLLNAKLLYSNKIFKAKNLNESQKVKVLSSFDKAKNVSEVKIVFETLNEGIKTSKTTIKENLGRASKVTNTPTTKQPIVESNDVFKRMQKLAGLI